MIKHQSKIKHSDLACVCVCVCVWGRILHAGGVCQSVLYGLPLIIRPTSCWQLDWDEMETNQQTFHALCHILKVSVWLYVCVCVHKAQLCDNLLSEDQKMLLKT